MQKKDNYVLQAEQAKRHFLTYDQEKLVAKLKAKSDEQYIYVSLLREPHRIDRCTVNIQRLRDDEWVDANSFEEVMTLLDLICDSREDRFLTGKWKSMANFGLQFHQNLLEEKREPTADLIDREPERFRSACLSLSGREIPNCDIGYAIELFDGLQIGIQFWHGDDEFYPRVRYLWDENALQYLRYETMYFAINLLRKRLYERMENNKQ